MSNGKRQKSGLGTGTKNDTGQPSDASHADAIRQAILSHFAASVVLVDRKGQILQFHGQTGKYLNMPTSEPRLNLLDAAKEGLSLRLRAALHTALNEGKPVVLDAVALTREDGARLARVTVAPVARRGSTPSASARQESLPQETGPLLVVIFEDVPRSAVASTEPAARETQERLAWLARLPDENPNPELQVSAEGIVLCCNPAATELPGWACRVGEPVPVPLPKLLGEALAQGEQVQVEAAFGERTFLVWAVPSPQGCYANIYARDITGRKRAEEELRLAYSRLKAFFDRRIGGIGIVIANTKGDIIEANDYYLDILGCTREELEAGKVRWREMTSPEWLPADEKALAQLRERGACEPFEKEYVRRDGSRVPVLITNVMMPEHGSEILAIVVNMTERKRAEEALRQSEEHFRALAEALPQIVWTADVEGGVEWFNRRWYEYTGQPEGVGEGWSWDKVAHSDDMAHTLENWAHARRSGTLFQNEIRVRGHDGEYRWFLARAWPLRDANGNVVHWFGTNTDIHSMKAAETALRQSREDLDRAQAVGQIGSWRLDVGRNVLTWSDENHRIFGLPKGTPMTYETFLGIVHPDDRQYVDTQWKAGLAGEPYDIEHRIVMEEQVKWVREKAYLEFDSAGKVLGGFGITQDITDRKAAEGALRQAAEDLKRSNQDLEQFASVASHDLQEPLRMVSGFLKLLDERYKAQLDDKAKEYIGYSMEGASRMSQLITDLLAYSRVASKGKTLGPVDSNRPLAAALANLHGRIQEAGATVTHDELPSVVGDVSLLTQLFQNLIGNAIKFRGPDRPCQVHVSAKTEGGQCLFSVRDNGIGIPKEAFDRIFVIFQRLHTREKYTGTGIGLAICKKIVERHGGRIWVESKLGEGSTFYFAL